MKKSITSQSIEETWSFAKEIVTHLNQNILLLFGDLGSGKTTFVQGMARSLGIERRIPSPTFIIMRTYELDGKQRWKTFYHVDLYRVQSTHDIEELGILELMEDPQNLFAIEWPERLREFLPKNRVDIHFTYLDEQKREIRVSSI